jgi:hypothetical protein
LCVSAPQIDIFSGLFFGLIGGDLFNTGQGVCLVQDSSKWNNYYTHLGPGFVKTNIETTLKNKTEAKFYNVEWYK